MIEDPRRLRLSKHFVLSDFLGNHSVYSRGYANPFINDESAEQKLGNASTLCLYGLEPLLAQFGPMSVSYGYISPELSRKIITYQDPNKPSHHRWDLGAAADVCLHNWIQGNFDSAGDLYLPKTARSSPIALAHCIDYLDIPYSRMITYSESPYICLALSEREFLANAPRKAFYENRYMGVAKDKPEYRQYSSPQAKARALDQLQTQGLEHPWQGPVGYPTYHGGGFQQYQHMRVSAYTMVSDWLFDLKSISEGHKNVPALNLDTVQDSFAAAGVVYDSILDTLDIPRASIIAGYVSHTNPGFTAVNDWRRKFIQFKLMLPEYCDVGESMKKLYAELPLIDASEFGTDNGALVVSLEVDAVLNAG